MVATSALDYLASLIPSRRLFERPELSIHLQCRWASTPGDDDETGTWVDISRPRPWSWATAALDPAVIDQLLTCCEALEPSRLAESPPYLIVHDRVARFVRARVGPISVAYRFRVALRPGPGARPLESVLLSPRYELAGE